jgi:hypothetical protein
MKICVVGWYYYEDFYRKLEQVHERYPVIIIAHRKNEISYLPTVERENIGLEWGAYNHYLMNVWDGGDVLFTHDDTFVSDMRAFDKIAKIGEDIAFIHKYKEEAEANMVVHGRSFLASEKFLSFCKEQGGFWYDKENRGENYREDQSHNEGSRHMISYLIKWQEKFSTMIATIPEYCNGFRGQVGIDGLIKESFHLGYSKTKRESKEWLSKFVPIHG